MNTQIEIPEGICFSDTQSEINFERIASGGMSSGLLVIEGDKATGKTRLAQHLIELLGEKLRVMFLRDEKQLEHIFNVDKVRLAFFDEVRTSKLTLKNRIKRKPLKSPVMVGALEGGVLVILVGEEVDLAPDLERRAVRVRLGQKR